MNWSKLKVNEYEVSRVASASNIFHALIIDLAVAPPKPKPYSLSNPIRGDRDDYSDKRGSIGKERRSGLLWSVLPSVRVRALSDGGNGSSSTAA